eukprot:Cvel_34214.t1-p1 / transcript=Cvel_34214.t1 / gene=Cvel_34214 / organism=Chromera_velia_CCMP2878 / gene_product=hypothetical protein / transcript_product=hypothetical protein / location=Cvel_scaffold5799:1-809(-) / protein_length=190 / sequence_SO=supercontig / SO=protein_coding / is_pseudo=false
MACTLTQPSVGLTSMPTQTVNCTSSQSHQIYLSLTIAGGESRVIELPGSMSLSDVMDAISVKSRVIRNWPEYHSVARHYQVLPHPHSSRTPPMPPPVYHSPHGAKAHGRFSPSGPPPSYTMPPSPHAWKSVHVHGPASAGGSPNHRTFQYFQPPPPPHVVAASAATSNAAVAALPRSVPPPTQLQRQQSP